MGGSTAIQLCISCSESVNVTMRVGVIFSERDNKSLGIIHKIGRNHGDEDVLQGP